MCWSVKIIPDHSKTADTGLSQADRSFTKRFAMEIKEVKPISFLFYRTETNVRELGNFLHIGQELFREAVANHLPVTGPVHWHYFGFTGDDSKPFTLEIALPIADVP